VLETTVRDTNGRQQTEAVTVAAGPGGVGEGSVERQGVPVRGGAHHLDHGSLITVQVVGQFRRVRRSAEPLGELLAGRRQFQMQLLNPPRSPQHPVVVPEVALNRTRDRGNGER
jgi:hypothetical protein